MCSTTIEAGSKAWCLNNGRQTKGNTNHKFGLANLLQVTKSASGCISNKSIGTGMTKSESEDEIKCVTEIKETISTEMTVVTIAQSKVLAMTGLSINLYPIQKKEHRSSLSLPPFISLPFLTQLYKEKIWDRFWRNRNIGRSFPFRGSCLQSLNLTKS